jgi:hypothetical protein
VHTPALSAALSAAPLAPPSHEWTFPCFNWHIPTPFAAQQDSLKERYEATKGTTKATYDDWTKQVGEKAGRHEGRAEWRCW